jgi:hypothetical protein
MIKLTRSNSFRAHEKPRVRQAETAMHVQSNGPMRFGVKKPLGTRRRASEFVVLTIRLMPRCHEWTPVTDAMTASPVAEAQLLSHSSIAAGRAHLGRQFSPTSAPRHLHLRPPKAKVI